MLRNLYIVKIVSADGKLKLFLSSRLWFKSSAKNEAIHFSGTGFQAQVDMQPVNWNPPT